MECGKGVIDIDLRQLRVRAGLSQAELGRRMGIDPSIVRHVEAGRVVPYPRFRRLAAQILGCDEDRIFSTTPKSGTD